MLLDRPHGSHIYILQETEIWDMMQLHINSFCGHIRQ